MWSIWRTARRAPRAPSSASVSSRARRERTSAYSAMTKNAFTRTSTPVRKMNSPVKGAPARGSLRSLCCYFGVGRRSFQRPGEPSTRRCQAGEEVSEVARGDHAALQRQLNEADALLSLRQILYAELREQSPQGRLDGIDAQKQLIRA